VSERGSSMCDLPSALIDGEALNQRLAGRRPVVLLDYDGTLTPIVDRPQDAVISESMREMLRALAGRCTVCVVSGRDRPVVRELMGVEDLSDDMIDEHAFEALKGTGASESSSATLTIRSSPVARPQPTSSSPRSRRSNDSSALSHDERHGLHIGGSR
jgi:Trehalose-phosphatase